MDKGSMMESEDRIEKTVDIYISAEAVRDKKHKDMEDFNTSKTQTPQHTESDSVRIRSSRAALVCLVLLCVLLLTAVIVLGVYIHTNSTNYTEERDQLLTTITSLRKERGQLITNNTNLTDERDQLITKTANLTEERDQLIIQNGNLTKERDQLKSDKNKQICFDKVDGWTNYQYSVYFISSEKKRWTESRRYCTDRGADLIIINNRAEQNFVKNITSSADLVWIGLTDRDVEGTWKWVDGTSVTSG
ncbi:C-type lectin domain family 17, member A [Anabarilius grahami]|uniref:C-type lectin domain family 17, member A n=1 Tax=Anabarilius grahami TaxID=495550 RepID=A0A3N0XPK9_ANAGA|nr:C-type lectin domain family 17, member A [Anabarilius grahami]